MLYMPSASLPCRRRLRSSIDEPEEVVCRRPIRRLHARCRTGGLAGQFEMMERRMDTAVQAVKTVRPAFDAFYAALDDQQKAKVDELGPKRSGWLW